MLCRLYLKLTVNCSVCSELAIGAEGLHWTVHVALCNRQCTLQGADMLRAALTSALVTGAVALPSHIPSGHIGFKTDVGWPLNMSVRSLLS